MKKIKFCEHGPRLAEFRTETVFCYKTTYPNKVNHTKAFPFGKGSLASPPPPAPNAYHIIFCGKIDCFFTVTHFRHYPKLV
jgi:hypothetical protein